MKKYRMMGPGGEVLVTTAPNAAKAWSNLRYRLVRDFGLSWYKAANYDHSDLKEVADEH